MVPSTSIYQLSNTIAETLSISYSQKIIYNVSKQNYKEASKKFEYDVELKQTKSQ